MSLFGALGSARIWSLLLFLTLAFPKIAWAASGTINLEHTEPVATPPPSTFSLLIKLIVSLIVVGGLAYLTIQFLKRNSRISGGSENISLLDQYALGMNKGVYIIEVAGKVLVLGITDHNINVLYELQEPEVIARLRTKAAEHAGQGIMPPRFLEMFFKNRDGNVSQSSFSHHIQEQIKKLQSSTRSSGYNTTGEGDHNDPNKR